MTAHQPQSYDPSADIVRLIIAVLDEDGDAVVCLASKITEEAGMFATIAHLCAIINWLGVEQYGNEWLSVVGTVLDILDIEALTMRDDDEQ